MENEFPFLITCEVIGFRTSGKWGMGGGPYADPRQLTCDAIERSISTHRNLLPRERDRAGAQLRIRHARDYSERTNFAAIACWLQPTMLTTAAEHFFCRSASTAATHCQAAAAMRPSPRIRLMESLAPCQSCHAPASSRSRRGIPCKPSQSKSGPPLVLSAARARREAIARF